MNGHFSFVIYDLEEQSLFLVRDHLGVKPLFYTFIDKILLFASTREYVLLLITSPVTPMQSHGALNTICFPLFMDACDGNVIVKVDIYSTILFKFLIGCIRYINPFATIVIF